MSNWFYQNAKQRFVDRAYEQYEKAGHNSRIKRDQVKTLHKGQDYGAVERKRNLSTFKQQLTYETLIAMAIRSSPNQALTVAEIHAYIAEIYPYFKTSPGGLKASIIRTLSTRNCFVKLGEPCQHYWTFKSQGNTTHVAEKSLDQIGINSSKRSCLEATVSKLSNSDKQSKTTKVSKPTRKPTGKNDNWSQRKQDAYSACSQPVVQGTDYSLARVSTTPLHSQLAAGVDVVPPIAYTQENSRQTDLSHYDLLRCNTHNHPQYPRVPVIIPSPHLSGPEESGLKIDRVFSMNPQCFSVYQTAMPPCQPANELLQSKIVPYHPCTLWGSQVAPNLPTLSSFSSEDKERYEDA